MVSGTLAALSAAFGTTLTSVTSPHPDGSGSVTHRLPVGHALGARRIVGNHHRRARPRQPAAGKPALSGLTAARQGAAAPHDAAASGGSAAPLTALQVASFYQFPANTDGTGQTIAIIELGGGYPTADLATYFGGLGLPTPSVTAVGVDGGSNSPGQSADGEVELDIQVAGAVAPGASQFVYFAPNTDQGFIDANLRGDPRDADPGRGLHQLGRPRELVGRAVDDGDETP